MGLVSLTIIVYAGIVASVALTGMYPENKPFIPIVSFIGMQGVSKAACTTE